MHYPIPSSSLPSPAPRFKPRLIIHGGAGNIPDRDHFPPDKYEAFRKSLIRIAPLMDDAKVQVTRTNEFMTGSALSGSSEKAQSARKGPTALEVATFAVTQLEDDGLFNCGHGAVFTRDGVNELEASVMVSRGFKKRAVGVTGLRHVRNPILLARKMLEHGQQDLAPRGATSTKTTVAVPETDTDTGPDLDVPSAQGHTILHGQAAEQLAWQYGLGLVHPSYFFTQQRWDEHVRALQREREGSGLATWDADEFLPQGTTGAVVLDEDGVVCAATSTGGLTNKLTGRIGDTPVPGAGFWAEEWEEDGDPTAAADVGGGLDGGGGAWYRKLVAALGGDLSSSFSSSSSSSSPSVVLSGALRSFFADCLPTPFMYTPLYQGQQRQGQQQHAGRSTTTTTTTRSIGVSGTGNGDSFLRTNAARTVGAMARWKPESGASALEHVAGPGGVLQRSAEDRWRRTGEGEGGMIGVECAVVVARDAGGAVVDVQTRSAVLQGYNCGGMYRAWIDDEGAAVMSIWTNGAADYA